jgi:hypothetical protein
MVFFGLWEASSQKVSNLKQFFSFTHELIAVRKFGISKTVVSVESTWCMPDFQHVRKFHVVFHRPWGTTSTKWLWSDCVGKQENRTAEVSVNSLYLLELVMFPMCTSNDPARFALKRKFSHYLNIWTVPCTCIIPAWDFRLVSNFRTRVIIRYSFILIIRDFNPLQKIRYMRVCSNGMF